MQTVLKNPRDIVDVDYSEDESFFGREPWQLCFHRTFLGFRIV